MSFARDDGINPISFTQDQSAGDLCQHGHPRPQVYRAASDGEEDDAGKKGMQEEEVVEEEDEEVMK